MKSSLYLLYGIAMTMLLLSSCTESEIPFYKEEYNAVRFPERTEDNKEALGYDVESGLFKVSHSFITMPDVESFDYELPVELIGLVADVDREVAYEIEKSQSKAPDGSYEILNAVIPGGKRSGKITIRLFNDDVLRTEEYHLAIKLKNSNALNVGPVEFAHAVLSWSKRIPRPTHAEHFKTYNALIEGDDVWNSPSEDYFSPNALRVIVDALKWYDWDNWDKHGNNMNGSRYYNYKYLPRISIFERGKEYKAYALIINDYIENYNKEHPENPLVHDEGLNKGKLIKARVYTN